VKEPNLFDNYETEKITCKASDAAENLQLIELFGSSTRDNYARRCNVILWTSAECASMHISLLVFRRKLKTHLFRQSYPDIIL